MGAKKVASSHGEAALNWRGAGDWKISRSTIRCVQVVPHFG